MNSIPRPCLFLPTKDSIVAAHEAALLNLLDKNGWFYTVREYGKRWAIWWEAEDGSKGWW